ncbi:MAG: hypothetical protein ACTHMS_10885 [Jatrophihabitans sp.]|uniref:hypothetical protein n=1 Tax=Jatrophihabitans sp. TaxID=1932789 RepID=UPI003F809F4B
MRRAAVRTRARRAPAMGPGNRGLGPRIKAAITGSSELQERDALKSVGLVAAMSEALVARGSTSPQHTSRPSSDCWPSSSVSPAGRRVTAPTAPRSPSMRQPRSLGELRPATAALR